MPGLVPNPQGNAGAGARHISSREWVKGKAGEVPFSSQISTPSPSTAPVAIVYNGTKAQLPLPPDPAAIAGSLGIVVNNPGATAVLYLFDGTIWRAILSGIVWGPP